MPMAVMAGPGPGQAQARRPELQALEHSTSSALSLAGSCIRSRGFQTQMRHSDVGCSLKWQLNRGATTLALRTDILTDGLKIYFACKILKSNCFTLLIKQ